MVSLESQEALGEFLKCWNNPEEKRDLVVKKKGTIAFEKIGLIDRALRFFFGCGKASSERVIKTLTKEGQLTQALFTAVNSRSSGVFGFWNVTYDKLNAIISKIIRKKDKATKIINAAITNNSDLEVNLFAQKGFLP